MWNMERISSVPQYSLKSEDDWKIETSLLDNWHHLPGGPMSHSHSLPHILIEGVDVSAVGFNINQDDMDCPGQGAGSRHLSPSRRRRLISSSSSEGIYESDGCGGQLAWSSSSEGMYDSGEEDAGRRVRAMSIDDNLISQDDLTNANVSFSLAEDDSDEEEEADGRDDGEQLSSSPNSPTATSSGINTPKAGSSGFNTPRAHTPCQQDLLTPQSSFFKLERRASFDNGVFGMPDRILSGEAATVRQEAARSAVTAPGTPADPGTPVARCLSDEELMVDPEQVFTRIYSLLCAERVTQMTKTYNDIEAVTRLLEEKERDLELAARIGQTLLSKNRELSSRGEELDEQLTHANEKVNQLKHDLSMKDELLKFYCQDLQDESSGDATPSDGSFNLNKVDVDMLQKKVGSLEDENLKLRLESAQLRTDTETYEDKEKKLVESCLEQLAEVNSQVETFAGELRLKSEESFHQKEEITGLLAQVADLHKRVRQLTIENMDLAEKLQASQESQRQLTKELSSQHDKYDELFEMLEEAQDELRGHRNRNNPKATRHLYASAAFPSPMGGVDSLASELENSLQQQEKHDSDDRSSQKSHDWKVFETARAARKAAAKASRDSSVRMSTSTSSCRDPHSQATSMGNSDNESFNSDGYSADMDSLYGSCSELGRPGIPGSNDLESALRRLAIRRANDMNEHDYQESHREPKEHSSMFLVGDTPDSVASPASGYSYLGYSNSHPPTTQFKMSDKLQIVKPLEGSVTLKHWQRLAQPHLGGIFERREGVKVKGERKLDLEGEVYTLSDFEEDEDFSECPSRRADDSSLIYTFTNSVVTQPSEQSPPGWSQAGSLHPSGSTPQLSGGAGGKKRSNTSSTYTMSLGLAAILQGREASSSSSSRSLMRPIASCPVMPPDTSASSAPLPQSSQAGGMTTSPSHSGLFGKLISTGYSLLWNKSDDPVSSPPTPLPPTSEDRAKASPEKPTAKQILPKGSSTGVLGAIATFRKNGML